ncbi:MAG: 50S ribosomal protein L18 [Acidobacteriota bacterium]|nr:MAG: 50S ribosomal protein L18 [Acidobacteriota bacterium]
MANKLSRAQQRKRIHLRTRRKVLGTAELPRLCVFRSLKNTYAHLVDDSQGRTLGVVSTLKLNGKKYPNGGNVAAAKDVGTAIAQKAQELGFKKVVFDRNGCFYHGRIKALAEAAREAGLEF